MLKHTLLIATLLAFSVSVFGSEADYSPFSRLPANQDLELSPKATQIAFVENNVAHEAAILKVFNLKTQKMRALINSDNKRVKINWVHWKTEEILMVSVQYESKWPSGQRFYQSRLYSIDTTAKKIKKVEMLRTGQTERSPQYQDQVVHWLPNNPKYILMQADLDWAQRPDVYRVNIKTGKQIRTVKERTKIRTWIADRQAKVRVGYARDYDNENIVYWYRDNEDERFTRLFEYNNLTDKPIRVLGFDANPNELYYTKYDGNFKALYKMDMTTRKSIQLLKHEKYDVTGSLIVSKATNDVIGIRDSHSPFSRFYFDDTHYEFHRKIEEAIPDHYNSLVSFSDDEQMYIMKSRSDNSPPFYYLGDRQKNQLQGLLATYPEAETLDLPKHKKITYTARDGLEIEAYLTLPEKGSAPYPTVIHPHGGPGVRDYRGFDSWVSYMVNKGYAVLRPNFRGSSGFGYDFSSAQHGRWGLEMQDDLTDGVHYLFDEGIADKNRICIFGASYGGYAAMMATVKTPELYTCAVSFAGVSDLNLLKKAESRWVGGEKIADVQIGEKSSDVKSRSPINGVDKITTPLLIIHGSDDIVVKVRQSRRFAKKLKSGNKDFKYVELEQGDHHLSIQGNRSLFFKELDLFLTKHLGEATE